MAEDNGTSAAASPKHRLRKWLLYALGGIVVLALVAVGMVASWRHGQHNSLEAIRADAHEKGLATSMQEFIGKLPAVDEESNAATVYEGVFATSFEWRTGADGDYVPLVSRKLGRTTEGPGSATGQLRQAILDARAMVKDPAMPIPDYVLDDMKDYLSRRKWVFDRIHEAAALPQARYHIAWSGGATSTTHLAKMREAARLMSLAIMVDAEEGRPADAILKAREGIRMARSTEGQPIVIHSLVEMACYSIVQMGITRALARSTAANDDLLALQTDIESLSRGLSGRLPIEGQFANDCDTLNLVLQGKIPIPFPPAHYLRIQGTWYGDAIDRWVPPRLFMGEFEAETASWLRETLRIIDCAEPPDVDAIRREGRYRAAQDTGASVLTDQYGSQWGMRYLLELELTRAKARGTAAALAALRFRNDTGAWPPGLDALVPKYMDRIPLDPMTSRPMIYRSDKYGIAVYSVGTNGKDDGGHAPWLTYEDEDIKARRDDAGFRLWVDSGGPSTHK